MDGAGLADGALLEAGDLAAVLFEVELAFGPAAAVADVDWGVSDLDFDGATR